MRQGAAVGVAGNTGDGTAILRTAGDAQEGVRKKKDREREIK
jgi:hypothetical protein